MSHPDHHRRWEEAAVQPTLPDAAPDTRVDVGELDLPRASLRFPWGAVPLVHGSALHIGREGSPIAPELAAYPNVSRHHAEVAANHGAVAITDLGSANGTFVNEERLPPRLPRLLRHGDTLRFAANLIASVDLGGPP